MEEAEKYARKAIKINPNFSMANSNLAIILLEFGKLEEAETIIRKAIKLNSDSPNSNYILYTLFIFFISNYFYEAASIFYNSLL